MFNVLIYLTMFVLSMPVYADEATEQLKISMHLTEKRLDILEKNSAELIKKLNQQVNENGQFSKATQAKINALDAKLDAELDELNNKHQLLSASYAALEKDTAQKALTLDHSISSQLIYLLLAVLFVLLIIAYSYWYLRHRYDTTGNAISEKINKTLDAVESNNAQVVKADAALADSLMHALYMLKSSEINARSLDASQASSDLPIKLVDEIHRMRKRLALLPEDTVGLIQFQKALERLEAEFVELGYEIVD